MARLLYFADLVDRLGRASEEVVLPAEVTTVETLLAWLRTRRGPGASFAGRRRARHRLQTIFSLGGGGQKPG